MLDRSVSEQPPSEKSSDDDSLQAPLLNKSMSMPALETVDVEEGDSDDGVTKTTKSSVETARDLLKELTLPVKLLLWVYFALKFAAEMLVSESSVTTEFYFGWGSYTVSYQIVVSLTAHRLPQLLRFSCHEQVGIFLGLLGLTVLPMSAVVGNCISNIFEDR